MGRFRKGRNKTDPDEFVMQPPRSPGGTLTGKISTLFRREHQQKQEVAEATSTKKRSPGTSRSRLKHLASAAVSDNVSIGSRGSRDSKRIYYSSHHDDGSEEDSYESRASTDKKDILSELDSDGDDEDDSDGATETSTEIRGIQTSSSSATRTDEEESLDEDDEEEDTLHTLSRETSGDETQTTAVQTIRRYRGFSTSISSLFLDESLVCGAMGCFGLILSFRTEYLLQLRNERRGALSPRSFRGTRRSIPSRIIAGALLLALLLIFSTFLIFGFGTGHGHTNGAVSLNADGGDDGTDQWWDDYLSSNKNDDGENVGDDAANNDDGWQNEGQDIDDAQNGDDAVQEDDRNNVNQDDDDGNQQDEADENDGNNERRLYLGTESTYYTTVQHPLVGVFKMRDYTEYLWQPIYETAMNEWTNHPELSNRRRNEEEAEETDEAEEEEETVESDRITFMDRDLASDIRLAIFVAFILFLGVLGRRRRMRTRFHLIRARAQEDHLYYASSDEAAARRVAFDDTREDQYEGACSHTLCGCYPTDEVIPDGDEENVEVTDNGVFKRKTRPRHEDIVARTFHCLNATCCGLIFRCWFQCLSICALAQEAREVRLLIPPRYQRIDYITHQPFHEYQEAVNDLRRGWLGKARRLSGIMPHFAALSRLSRYILGVSLFTVIAIVISLFFNPRAGFTWGDASVLTATFAQAFFVLLIVHGIFHKSDLSLDAVIKMFAAGFLIATPTAFIFESIVASIGMLFSVALHDILGAVIGEDYQTWIGAHWRILWIVGELFNAYIVAAVTEELCKYYSFRAVEHPDLVFLTGLQREDHTDSTKMEGGIVKYPFGSHQVQELVRSRTFSDDASRASSRGTHRSSAASRRSRRSQALLKQTGTTDTEFDEDEKDARTRRQRAMAVTTGMISVAVGLACAENFLYVFVLGGTMADEDGEKGSVMEAWLTLLFRSIFPLHALSAAMQSINMVRKFVEVDTHKGHRVGVGRIILPAILLHGTFDAILLAVNVYVETAWENYLIENNGNVEEGGSPYNVILVNFIAIFGITSVMAVGVFWYYRENRSQRARLIRLEEQDKARQAEEWVGISGNDSPE